MIGAVTALLRTAACIFDESKRQKQQWTTKWRFVEIGFYEKQAVEFSLFYIFYKGNSCTTRG